MTVWNMVFVLMGLLVVTLIVVVVYAELHLRGKRKPAAKASSSDVLYLKMHDDANNSWHGKGVPCTYDEGMEYIMRWHEADSIVDKFSYIESSHIIGQRPAMDKTAKGAK